MHKYSRKKKDLSNKPNTDLKWADAVRLYNCTEEEIINASGADKETCLHNLKELGFSSISELFDEIEIQHDQKTNSIKLIIN